MAEAEIRNDRHGFPHHAYHQGGGRYLLCKRRAGLCKDCTEYGVPLTPADPFEVACDQIRALWGLWWNERFYTVADTELANELKPGRGAHIIAYDRAAKVSHIVASFGDDESIMASLGALVTVYNERLTPSEVPAVAPEPAVATVPISFWKLSLLVGLTPAQRAMVAASGPDDVTGDEGIGVELSTGAHYATARALKKRGLGQFTGPGGPPSGMYWNNLDGLAARSDILKEQSDG